ncbi:hypothetical protein ES703_40339 [subsurface metagenome]
MVRGEGNYTGPLRVPESPGQLLWGGPGSLSTVHSISVFAFKNKTKINFVDGESLYLAEYDNAVVSESWTSIVSGSYNKAIVSSPRKSSYLLLTIIPRLCDNFLGWKISLAGEIVQPDLPWSGRQLLTRATKEMGSGGDLVSQGKRETQQL